MSLCGLDISPRPGPPDPDDPCCYAAALDPDDCTCWEPVHDRDQEDPAGYTTVEARTVPCHDCAYRPDSPEIARGDEPPGPAQPFWCHQGMRRITRWQHPATPFTAECEHGAYDPPMRDGIPYRADGRKAQLCAGWLAQHAAFVDHDLLDERMRP